MNPDNVLDHINLRARCANYPAYYDSQLQSPSSTQLSDSQWFEEIMKQLEKLDNIQNYLDPIQPVGSQLFKELSKQSETLEKIQDHLNSICDHINDMDKCEYIDELENYIPMGRRTNELGDEILYFNFNESEVEHIDLECDEDNIVYVDPFETSSVKSTNLSHISSTSNSENVCYDNSNESTKLSNSDREEILKLDNKQNCINSIRYQISNFNDTGDCEFVDELDNYIPIELTHDSPILLATNSTVPFNVNSKPNRDNMCFNQAEIDHAWLQNINIELDELERLIFAPMQTCEDVCYDNLNEYIPKSHISSSHDVITKLEQIINYLPIESNTLNYENSNHDVGELEHKKYDTSIANFGCDLDIVGTTFYKDINKYVGNPSKGDYIDFIIPIFYPPLDQSNLLKHVNQFSNHVPKHYWRCTRRTRMKIWLGKFPYWIEFGSIEFMPIYCKLISLLPCAITSSWN